MPEIDDLRLNDSSDPGPPLLEPPPRTGPSLLIPGLVIVAIIGIGAAVLLWPKSAPPKAALQASDHAVTAASKPQAEPGDNIPLPPLDETDPLVRQLVSQLSSHPRVTAWLATQGLLRNFAAVVASVADGETPIAQLRNQRPTAPFAVRDVTGGTTIDPASFRRYDSYADAVAGLDPRGTAKLYATLKPRIVEAYTDLGYPEGDIDGALTRAIIILLRTPPSSESLAVKHTSVNWQFVDPQIESLPQAQRQLLRMGPRNEKMIQDKLREIAPYLGFDVKQKTEDGRRK
jgi:Protein of unknown function (DUF3014)